MVWNNQTKHTSIFTKVSKHFSLWDRRERSGKAWTYNDNNLTYNQAVDPDSGDTVYYNGLGSTTTWSNLTKH